LDGIVHALAQFGRNAIEGGLDSLFEGAVLSLPALVDCDHDLGAQQMEMQSLPVFGREVGF
jgi:hypothetical protein